MTRLRAILGFILTLFAMATPAAAPRALEIEFNGGPVRRDIIAIYDSRHEKTPQTTRIHQFAEMPLNWLGLSLTYVDANGPLPPPEQLAKYRGVVSWLIEPMAQADAYLAWLDGATAAGLKLAVFSDMAPASTPRAERTSARIHARLGLQATGDHVSVTHRVKLRVETPEMIGFEHPIDKVVPDFRVIRRLDPRTVVHLAAEIPGQPDASRPVLIATGPAGGYVADEFSIVFDANTDRVRWTLNPFLFLKQALARDRMPVPDVTTLSGRRIYFSHIDGDGWNNVSQIDGYRQGQVLSADVVRREAIEAFPDLPVSVGVIASDMLPEYGGSAAGRAIARKIYALPQVEVASHTYTHPFDWSFFENYSRAKEEELIDKVRTTNLPMLERARQIAMSITGSITGQSLANPGGRYVAGSSDLPRTYLRDPFDVNREIGGALAFSESLAPPGKKAKLLQWSGNCLPFEAAVKAVRMAGARNMNGGDSRLDAEFPSVFYVPPISKPVGAERQIYSANSNENTYTNDWTGPYYGFSLLGETVRNTETPRRLKPFNIYYHMYSGERESALAALRLNLSLARSSSLTPVAASRYAAMADDFFSVDIAQIDAQSWSVRNRGEVQTVRFDDADGIMIDPGKSRGVLGSTRHGGGAMYVALDPAVETALVAVTARQADAPPAFTGPGAQLVSARWLLRGYEADGCGFKITAEGFGGGDMLWQTAPGRKFDVTAERDGREFGKLSVAADAAGTLQLTVPGDAMAPVKLRFACRE